MGATAKTRGLEDKKIFQSTPPYGGDQVPVDKNISGKISIHAPVWGRRPRVTYPNPKLDFNPRPRMGATVASWKQRAEGKFQSTPPYGGDLHQSKASPPRSHFNPRPRMGATVRRDSTIFSVTLVLFRESHLQDF